MDGYFKPGDKIKRLNHGPHGIARPGGIYTVRMHDAHNGLSLMEDPPLSGYRYSTKSFELVKCFKRIIPWL